MAPALEDKYLANCDELVINPSPPVMHILAKSAQSDVELRGSKSALFNHRLDGMQICAVAKSLWDDVNVVSLDLSYNFIDDAGAESIAHLLKMNTTLRVLNLAGNSITSAGSKALAAVLAVPKIPGRTNAIEVLNLSGNPIGNAGAQALAQMLEVNFRIKVLNLGNTDMGVEGIISICSALAQQGSSKMEDLCLERPLLHGPQKTVVTHIANMLAVNSAIKSLNLSKFGMVDSDFDDLVTYGLTKNSSMCELQINSNQLSGFAGATIQRLLGASSTLSTLNVAHNNLGTSGALLVASCLSSCASLKHIDLRSNSIGDKGLVTIADALKSIPSISSCLVWGNTFGSVSCSAFSSMLKHRKAYSSPLLIDIEPYEVDGEVKVAWAPVQEFLEFLGFLD